MARSSALADLRDAEWAELEVLEELHTRRMEGSNGLRWFVQDAWQVVEPFTPFVPNWHIDAICDHLQAVTKNEINYLLITMPPRHLKSIAVSVMWPCWEWGPGAMPHTRWIFSAYAASLSLKDAVKRRQVLDSPWYRKRWGDRFTLGRAGYSLGGATKYENSKAGYHMATSVEGSNTGEGGDRIVADDPHNMKEIHSEAKREAVLFWWDQVMSTRRNHLKSAARVVIMQRGHELDLVGHILDTSPTEVVHLNLPTEYEGNSKSTVIGFRDPRTKPGELLFPARFGASEVVAAKKELGAYGWAAQHQQHPAPVGGGIFQRAWFDIVDAVPADIVARCRFWDCAGTAGDGDYTVGTKVAMASNGFFYIEHVVRGQWTALEVERIIHQTALVDTALGCRVREEQEPGSSGKAVIASRSRLLVGFDYRGIPSSGEKSLRWHPFAAQCEAGNVKLLKGPWNNAWIDEMCIVPNGAHDDQADSASGAFGDLTARPPMQVMRMAGF